MLRKPENSQEKSTRSRNCRKKLGITFSQLPPRYQKYRKQLLFRKNKDFQVADDQIIGKQEKDVYILDVICNRFYFVEVQEEVIGYCSEKGILRPRTEGLSVYQWPVSEKKSSREVEEMSLSILH